jgi:hypothetical protein
MVWRMPNYKKREIRISKLFFVTTSHMPYGIHEHERLCHNFFLRHGEISNTSGLLGYDSGSNPSVTIINPRIARKPDLLACELARTETSLRPSGGRDE